MGCGEPRNGLHGKTPAFYSTAGVLTMTATDSAEGCKGQLLQWQCASMGSGNRQHLLYIDMAAFSIISMFMEV